MFSRATYSFYSQLNKTTSGKITEIINIRIEERKTSYKRKCIRFKQKRITKQTSLPLDLFTFEYDYEIKSCIGYLESSRYVNFITVLNYILFVYDNICFQLDSSWNIFILIYSLSTANYPLENETYGHKRDSFAAALAHNGIVTAVRCFA